MKHDDVQPILEHWLSLEAEAPSALSRQGELLQELASAELRQRSQSGHSAR